MMKRNLSDAPLQIVFALFDANQDGNLAASELVTVSNILGLPVFTKLLGSHVPQQMKLHGKALHLHNVWLFLSMERRFSWQMISIQKQKSI